MKNDEYIVELGKALYDPDTGAAVFKPEFREKITRCRDCKHYDAHDHRCKVLNHGVDVTDFCSRGERREDE